MNCKYKKIPFRNIPQCWQVWKLWLRRSNIRINILNILCQLTYWAIWCWGLKDISWVWALTRTHLNTEMTSLRPLHDYYLYANTISNSHTVHSHYYDYGYIDSTAYYDTFFHTLLFQSSRQKLSFFSFLFRSSWVWALTRTHLNTEMTSLRPLHDYYLHANTISNSHTVHSHYYDDGYFDSTAYYDTFFHSLPIQSSSQKLLFLFLVNNIFYNALENRSRLD